MFFGKNRISNSARSSVVIENGQINSIINKPLNFLNSDETKQASPQPSEHSLFQPQYGKTLSVPDPNASQVVPVIITPAPITPPRPAIMTTPKASLANSKNNSAAELRPTLMVTTINDQQQPKTITVPNSRRLPVNGRIATIAPTKPRQQPVTPMGNNNQHQMIDETTPKNAVVNRARPAVYIPGTRMRMSSSASAGSKIFYLENSNQTFNNGNNTTNRYTPIDSHAPMGGNTKTWAAVPKFVFFPTLNNRFDLFL